MKDCSITTFEGLYYIVYIDHIIQSIAHWKNFILNNSYLNKNKAESELEGKRDELRSKLLADLEDKKKALEIEKLQVQSFLLE